MNEEVAATVAQAAFLALISEKILELYARRLFDKFKWDTDWILAIALVQGLVIAFGFGVNLLAPMGYVETIPYLGIVISGFIVGGGSSIIYDLWSKPARSITLTAAEK